MPRPWVHCQQPMCVRPHAVGIYVSTRRRAHVRALLPVRGVKRPHLLNNSLALSSSLRAKGCSRSYLPSRDRLFKSVWLVTGPRYGTKLGILCQQPMCVRPHAVGICVSTRRRAHVRALLPVRGVKPREYGSDTPVTTRPRITAKIYSTC